MIEILTANGNQTQELLLSSQNLIKMEPTQIPPPPPPPISASTTQNPEIETVPPGREPPASVTTVAEETSRRRIQKKPKDYNEVTAARSPADVKSGESAGSKKRKIAQDETNSRKKVIERREPSKRAKSLKKKTAASQSKPKYITLEENAFDTSLRELGKVTLTDLLQLTSALVQHEKSFASSSSLREKLQEAMKDSTGWSGDQCARFLVPIAFGSEKLDDLKMTALLSRNTSAQDIVDKFRKRNWWTSEVAQKLHPTQGTSDAVGKISSHPSSIELAAFGLWATNCYASGDTDESTFYERWQQASPEFREHFLKLAEFEERTRVRFRPSFVPNIAGQGTENTQQSQTN